MKFKLSEAFLEKYKDKQPNWGYGALGYVVYKRTYARLKEDGTTEEFWETLKRVVEGTFTIQKEHCENLGLIWDSRRAQKSAQIMFDKMWNFKFLPPGRGLWAMGTDAIKAKGSAILNNCAMVSTKDLAYDFSTPFCWLLDMLCLGVGVGFDTKGANTVNIKSPKNINKTKFIIPDTREGWVEAFRILLDAFASGGDIPEYDYSLIRPLGAPIKTFGGTSSGPEPLQKLLTSVQSLLLSRVGQKLSSVDIVDIMNFAGRCAVAGNVRRSAEIALGEHNDIDFIDAKNPEKYSFELSDRRWASNNSVFVEEFVNYTSLAKLTAKNGEPGYVWLGNARAFGRMKDAPDYKDSAVVGTNPCGEQPLENMELCNLVEVFPAKHDSVEEFYDTLKYAYLYAKTVTLVPTHDARTNAVMLRNRRIGCSLSGIEQAKIKFGVTRFYQDFCDEGYKIIKHWDKIYSNWLCIPRSIKVTTVKPAGTVSLLVGSTPGVHAAHAQFYFRTMRLAHNSPLVKVLLDAGYRIEYGVTEWKEGLFATHKWNINCHYKCNDDSNSNFNGCMHEVTFEPGENITQNAWRDFALYNPVQINDGVFSVPNFVGTLVVYFPIKEDNFSKGKSDQTIWEQVENAAKMQYYWSDNAVSVTVSFKDFEAKDIKTILEHYESRLKAISFLPLNNHGYDQAPYITIDEWRYSLAIKNIAPIKYDFASDKRFDMYCEGDKCEIK